MTIVRFVCPRCGSTGGLTAGGRWFCGPCLSAEGVKVEMREVTTDG